MRDRWMAPERLGGGALILAMLVSPLAAATDFERDVAPILLRRCLECHHAGNPSGGLNLATAAGLKAGGENGPVVVADRPDASYLVERVEKGEMPPARQGKPRKLTDAEARVLRDWIASGAAWPAERRLDLFERTNEQRGGRDWWSFQPVRRPDVAAVRDPSRATTVVDRFILKTLEDEGRSPAPPAQRRALLRRLAIDLTGLPPDADAIDAFSADEAPDAYERLVDRLLASPRFGERWGRYWLDIARYAETSGYERDQEKPHAWRYRDWVIRALNEDLPYDQFVRAQLAGDELPERSEAQVIATGFLRLGTWNDEPNDAQEYKYERLEDLVHATSTAFLGLTTKCARCHDHKFDPIPQLDYYRMAAAFWAGPIEPRGRELLGGPTREELGADVLGWTDISAAPPPLRWLKKGDPHRPADEVSAGFLTLLPQLDRPLTPPAAGARTTQRRRQLAEWIVDPRNPLTTRIAVNRLWLHHFGQALVRSPDNFGFTGQRPTHPELLDWLADELVRSGWRLKPLHRLLVTSAVYRQSSIHPNQDEYQRSDFANRTWWRAERRRVEAELLRDALLAASGQLDLRLGGPSFKPVISAQALEGLSRQSGAWQPSPAAEQGRRSVYIYSQRSLLAPLLTTFDFVDTTLPCAQRDVSTVAPQALALLNNEFAHQQSEEFAARVAAVAGDDDQQAIRAAWRMALGRDPTATETRAAERHLAIQRANFARQEKPPETTDAPELPVRERLVLWLDAADGATPDDAGRVAAWRDRSGNGHDAAQSDARRRPEWVRDALHGRPVVRFDGQRRCLTLAGQVLTNQQFTVAAIVADRGTPGHREVFSNWDGGAGNAGSSVFVGLTATAAVRLSDDLSGGGQIEHPAQPFLLLAVSGVRDAAIFQNQRAVVRKGGPLSPRNLRTPYVIGQQGNIDGEYWTGDVAELLVYDRELSDIERLALSRWLVRRHGLTPPAPLPIRDANRLALASLCHVLLNSNEFVYVD